MLTGFLYLSNWGIHRLLGDKIPFKCSFVRRTSMFRYSLLPAQMSREVNQWAQALTLSLTVPRLSSPVKWGQGGSPTHRGANDIVLIREKCLKPSLLS